MHLRPGTTRDADRLVPLMGQLGYPTAAAVLAPRLERLLSHPEYAVWIAEGDEGALHGLAVGHVMFSIEDDGLAAQLTALVVDRSARGTGLGRRLVEIFENWAVENAAVRVIITSATHRAAAHSFYEHLGYEHTGRRFGKRLMAPQAGP